MQKDVILKLTYKECETIREALRKHMSTDPLSKTAFNVVTKQVGFNTSAFSDKALNDKGQEMLTEAKMKELFGINYDYIMCYNYDTRQWNHNDFYVGYEIKDRVSKHKKTNESRIQYEKNCIDGMYKTLKTKLAKRNMELVASVTMPECYEQIPEETLQEAKSFKKKHSYPVFQTGRQTIIQNPKFAITEFAVGTVITRDLQTGKINPISSSWVMITGFLRWNTPFTMTKHARTLFMSNVAKYNETKSALISTLVQQNQK